MPATIWVDNVRSQPIFIHFFQIYCCVSWDQNKRITWQCHSISAVPEVTQKASSMPSHDHEFYLTSAKRMKAFLWVTLPGYCVSSPPGTLWPGSLPWRNPSKRSWLRGSVSEGQPPYSHSPLCYRPWRSEEMSLRSHEVCSLYQFKYRR